MSWNISDRDKREYIADIALLRKKFLGTDITDPEQLRRWFDEHSNISHYDHSMVMGVSYEKVMEFRKLAGLPLHPTGENSREEPIYGPLGVEINPPADWRTNKEWMEYVLQSHGVKKLAKAMGIDRTRLRSIFRKFGLGGPRVRAANPYDNEAWVHENYVIKGQSLKQCAKAAGVCVQTFIRWMQKYHIKARTKSEAAKSLHGFNHRSPVWAKELAKELEKLKIVRRATCRTGFMQVSFTHGVKENWHYDAHDASKSRLNIFLPRIEKFKPFHIHEQYGRELDRQYHHYIIERKKYKKAHVAAQRIAIHELIDKMRNAPDFILPPDALKADLARIKAFPASKCSNRGILHSTPQCSRRLPGWDAYLHFFGGALFNQRRNARTIRKGVHYLLAHRRYDITTVDVVRTICTHDKRKIYSPVVYGHLLDLIGFKGGSVLDVHPHYGQRTLALGQLGNVDYYTEPDELFDKSDMASAIGMNHSQYAGEIVDLCIIDNNMQDTTVDVAAYMAKARHVLLFCSGDKLADYEHLAPAAKFGVNVRFKRACNYYLFW